MKVELKIDYEGNPYITCSQHGDSTEDDLHCGSEAWSRSHKNRERGQAYDVIEDKYFSKTEQISLGGM